ncbi:hypothetical protein [Streptomyces sp. NPDC059009]|uniref:hypothetical protein n=1 Tax=Streptomyces sp. NPDC059009 TaxID=3346694 RepID=UPI0036BEA4AC
MADARMNDFRSLGHGVPQLCDRLTLSDHDRAAVGRHVDSMVDMLSGNYHWSRSCGRYSPEAAAHLSPDRPGLLALHGLAP